ncbi:MAG TPA: 2-C-methyl-D-erythritol 2,4-cyclodiphosphate synthase [Bacillales bacterium]|nr:2-C-methyl-D-erythritol 2,4-cyclodiphosphate synthase [Bacillales bacterium]
MMRIGHGFDVHRLADGRPLILGGIRIPYEKGLDGHSDADVLLHAVSDALLGAAALGDIGKHFPDTDPAFRDADSAKLLEQVYRLLKERNYKCVNLDATVIAQQPKLAPYIEKIRKSIASILEIEGGQVNVKATTTEKLGYPGRGEGIAAESVVLIEEEK